MPNIEKILLILPPRTIFEGKETIRAVPPLGLAYLARVLENNGYQVKILDCVIEGLETKTRVDSQRIRYGLSPEEIGKKIIQYQPDLVGISSLFSAQHENADILFNLAKSIDRDIVTVTGGAHPSAVPREVMKNNNLDYIVLGEGEVSFIQLLSRIQKDRQPDDVDGVSYRNNGSVIVKAKTQFIENLDEIPFPARHLLPVAEYSNAQWSHFRDENKVNYLVSSRGCRAQCIYCSVHACWGDFRARSPGNVLTEMEMMVDEGYDEIQFMDDNLTADKKRAAQIFQGILDRNLNIRWTAPSGTAIYTLDEPLLDLMKESGCYHLVLPVESANQELIRKIMKKPINLRKVKPVVDYARTIGIKTEAFFMIGFPGETKEDIQRTVDFARELGTDYCCFYIVTPLPGTELFAMCEEKGYLVENSSKNFKFSQGNIKTPEFTPEYLEQVRYDAWKSINFPEDVSSD
jgi:magnesium-protoporphyrin IX monomethyl ester (oxidative) cyclase